MLPLAQVVALPSECVAPRKQLELGVSSGLDRLPVINTQRPTRRVGQRSRYLARSEWRATSLDQLCPTDRNDPGEDTNSAYRVVGAIARCAAWGLRLSSTERKISAGS